MARADVPVACIATSATFLHLLYLKDATSYASTALDRRAWASSRHIMRCPCCAGLGHAQGSCGMQTPMFFRRVQGRDDPPCCGDNLLREYVRSASVACCASAALLLGHCGSIHAVHPHSQPAAHPQELTPRDRSQATNLAASLATAAPEWAAELQAMLASGSKVGFEQGSPGTG